LYIFDQLLNRNSRTRYSRPLAWFA